MCVYCVWMRRGGGRIVSSFLNKYCFLRMETQVLERFSLVQISQDSPREVGDDFVTFQGIAPADHVLDYGLET